MVHVMGDAGCWLLLGLTLLPIAVLGSQDDGKVIHISRVQHQAVRVGLGEPVALPCLFLLHPSASLGPNEPLDPPRVKWSKVRSASGQREDVPILVAKDNVVKVVKAYEGRVSLPGYARDRYNGTLLLRAARASDAGLYRCEVVAGIDDEQDLLPLEVMGVVFHYRPAGARYALTFAAARRACMDNSAVIASPQHLQAAFEDGYDNCDAGWLADQSVRYPITLSRPGCYGDRNSLPGVRSYGQREPGELYDVYCYTRELQGKVFYATAPGRFTLSGARRHCRGRGAALATTGQLYLAWREGLDQCDPGWLADGSVRYPILAPRRKCGGEAPGVRTLYRFPNRTGFPPPTSKFDAYCYKGDTAGAPDSTVEQREQEPLGSDNVLVEREDMATSGDSPRAGVLRQLGAAGPGGAEDEQLQLASSVTAAWRGDIPGGSIKASSSSPSSSVWPLEDEALNVVDQAPRGSTQELFGSSPALREFPDPTEPLFTLHPQTQSPAQEIISSAPPALGTVPMVAAETPSTPKQSSYAGLNGRYFQLQQQSRDPLVAQDPTVADDHTVAGDPAGTITQAPILALEVKGAAANTVETWSITRPSAESPHRGGLYPLSNEVEEEIGHKLLAPSTIPVPPSQRDLPQWSPSTAPHGPGDPTRRSLSSSPSTPVAPSDASHHQDVSTGEAQPRGDSPQPPADVTEDFSGDAAPKEDDSPIPPWPPLPPAPLVAEDPGTAAQPISDSGGALGDGSLERQRKAVTFVHPPMGLPGSPSPTAVSSPHPQSRLSPTDPQGALEMGAEPTSEHLDVGTGLQDEAAITPVAPDVPSASPTDSEVTPQLGSEWPLEGSGRVGDGPTAAPQHPNPSEPGLEGEEHPSHPPDPQQPPSPGEEDTSEEAKNESPTSTATHPPASPDTHWPSPTTPHPWVPDGPEAPSAGPLFEPTTPGGAGGALLLDADSGSGEEPVLEEQELLLQLTHARPTPVCTAGRATPTAPSAAAAAPRASPGRTVRSTSMTACRAPARTAAPASMRSTPSSASACPATEAAAVRKTRRAVTTTGTSSRATATATSPGGAPGRTQSVTAAGAPGISPASTHRRSTASSTALGTRTPGSGSTTGLWSRISNGRTTPACNTRTGGRTNPTTSLRAVRTAWCWFPTRSASGTTCPATTTCPTSARRAQCFVGPPPRWRTRSSWGRRRRGTASTRACATSARRASPSATSPPSGATATASGTGPNCSAQNPGGRTGHGGITGTATATLTTSTTTTNPARSGENTASTSGWTGWRRATTSRAGEAASVSSPGTPGTAVRGTGRGDVP